MRAIVALGGFAWDAALRVLRELGNARRRVPVSATAPRRTLGDVTLLGSYHPSQQNTFTGRLREATSTPCSRDRARSCADDHR